MIFGIWPGIAQADHIASLSLDCPPEDVPATRAALDGLQGPAERFYVRCYRGFGAGNTNDEVSQPPTPVDPRAYLGAGRQVDLVCCYSTTQPDPQGFAEYVRAAVRDAHAWGGGKVQVGEELNMPAPFDGGSPGCFDAVAAGVRAAAEERRALGSDVRIGVNAAGFADAEFWTRLADHLRPNMDDLDYLGVDFFPDVFRPIPHESLPDTVRSFLTATRQRTTDAGFPSHLPLHITETGWPTGQDRDEDTQARVLPLVVHAVLTSGQNVAAYEFFGLRDTLSNGDWRHQFGLLKDDYTPKLAFAQIAALITDTG